MRLYLIALWSIIPACPQQPVPEASHPTTNEHYEVDELFTHDGCKVYRFEDRNNGRDVYYVTCGDQRVTTREEHSEKSGKHQRTVSNYVDTVIR